MNWLSLLSAVGSSGFGGQQQQEPYKNWQQAQEDVSKAMNQQIGAGFMASAGASPTLKAQQAQMAGPPTFIGADGKPVDHAPPGYTYDGSVLPPMGTVPTQHMSGDSFGPIPSVDLPVVLPGLASDKPQSASPKQNANDGSPSVGMGSFFNLLGTPKNPNMFVRMGEGYNRGGLMGSLGYLLTNFNQR